MKTNFEKKIINNINNINVKVKKTKNKFRLSYILRNRIYM